MVFNQFYHADNDIPCLQNLTMVDHGHLNVNAVTANLSWLTMVFKTSIMVLANFTMVDHGSKYLKFDHGGNLNFIMVDHCLYQSPSWLTMVIKI